MGARLADRARTATHISVVPEGTSSLESEESVAHRKLRQRVIDVAAPNPDGRQKDCYGKTNAALVELLDAGYPFDKLMRVLDHRPTHLGVPKLVAWLVDQATVGFLALPSDDALRQAIREHELKARTWRTNGEDDRAQDEEDAAGALRRQLGEPCETDLMEVS